MDVCIGMALERVPYPGSTEYQYDSAPGLANRFTIGRRDLAQLTSSLQPVLTNSVDHSLSAKPGLESVAASANEAQDAVETEVPVCASFPVSAG